LEQQKCEQEHLTANQTAAGEKKPTQQRQPESIMPACSKQQNTIKTTI